MIDKKELAKNILNNYNKILQNYVRSIFANYSADNQYDALTVDEVIAQFPKNLENVEEKEIDELIVTLKLESLRILENKEQKFFWELTLFPLTNITYDLDIDKLSVESFLEKNTIFFLDIEFRTLINEYIKLNESYFGLKMVELDLYKAKNWKELFNKVSNIDGGLSQRFLILAIGFDTVIKGILASDTLNNKTAWRLKKVLRNLKPKSNSSTNN